MKVKSSSKSAGFRLSLLRAALIAFPAVLVPLTFAQPDARIQDNSFLVEEAYNQEFGIVQHISNFIYLADSKDWAYTFTQEWPVTGIRHQFSYTLIALRQGSFSSQGAGFGDVFLNYRYQAIGNGQTRVAFAPRLCLTVPSGNSDLGRGFGAAGVQTNLPLSFSLNRKFVTHWNAGATFVPHARNSDKQRASAVAYNLGQSVIWETTPRFNVMMETFFLSAQKVVGPGKTEWSNTLFLSPGIRWAYNFKNGLQIVPGIAMPVGTGPSAGEKGVFLYLSFEHPFRK
jgi:Putative MetA-pathway of phenol degradation